MEVCGHELDTTLVLNGGLSYRGSPSMDICDFRFARLYGVGSGVCVQCLQLHKSITLLDEASVNGTNKINQFFAGWASLLIQWDETEGSRPFLFINQVTFPLSSR